MGVEGKLHKRSELTSQDLHGFSALRFQGFLVLVAGFRVLELRVLGLRVEGVKLGFGGFGFLALGCRAEGFRVLGFGVAA